MNKYMNESKSYEAADCSRISPPPSHLLTVGQTEANKGQRFNEYMPVCAAAANRITHSAGHITEHINKCLSHTSLTQLMSPLIRSFPTGPAE